MTRTPLGRLTVAILAFNVCVASLLARWPSVPLALAGAVVAQLYLFTALRDLAEQLDDDVDVDDVDLDDVLWLDDLDDGEDDDGYDDRWLAGGWPSPAPAGPGFWERRRMVRDLERWLRAQDGPGADTAG